MKVTSIHRHDHIRASRTISDGGRVSTYTDYSGCIATYKNPCGDAGCTATAKTERGAVTAVLKKARLGELESRDA